MRIDGQCHCGHVSYEAEIDPDRVSICYCTDCQVLTGSAFRVTVLATHDAIRHTGEEPKVYAKTGANGATRLQLFCPACGTPVFTTVAGEDAREWGIRWGTIRQRAELPPRRRIWCRSAPEWIGTIADLPGIQGEG